jgi:hypothetical protein
VTDTPETRYTRSADGTNLDVHRQDASTSVGREDGARARTQRSVGGTIVQLKLPCRRSIWAIRGSSDRRNMKLFLQLLTANARTQCCVLTGGRYEWSSFE